MNNRHDGSGAMRDLLEGIKLMARAHMLISRATANLPAKPEDRVTFDMDAPPAITAEELLAALNDASRRGFKLEAEKH